MLAHEFSYCNIYYLIESKPNHRFHADSWLKDWSEVDRVVVEESAAGQLE